MKLRMRGNSVRLRLRRSEVGRLVECGRVEERVEFPRPASSQLVYVLELSAAAAAIECLFADAQLTVRVPAEMALAWARSDQVSLEGSEPLPKGGTLQVLVEKDFECLHGPSAGEAREDYFPNPRRG